MKTTVYDKLWRFAQEHVKQISPEQNKPVALLNLFRLQNSTQQLTCPTAEETQEAIECIANALKWGAEYDLFEERKGEKK